MSWSLCARKSLIFKVSSRSHPGIRHTGSCQGPGNRAGDALATRLVRKRTICLALIDSQFRIVNANHSLCRMLGYDEREILSLHIQDIAQEPDACMRLIEQVLLAVVPASKIEGNS